MLKNKSLFFLFLFSSLNLFGQEILDTLGPVDTAMYHLEWGSLKVEVPSEELLGKGGMKFSELKANLDQPIRFFKNGVNQQIENFSLVVYTPVKKGLPNPAQGLNAPNSFVIKDYKEKKSAAIHGVEILGSRLTPKSVIYLYNLMGKDSVAFNFTIAAIDENPPYRPAIKIPEIPKGESFGFQIIDLENEKTKLRIDTTNETTKHIYKMYNKPDKYEIVHIPNFRTTRRMLSDVDFLEKKEDENEIVLLENIDLLTINPLDIPEFTDYHKGKAPEMIWGEMKSPKDIEKNYSIYDLQDALGSRFFIVNGFQNLNIIRMKVTILPESADSQSFITSSINHPQLNEALQQVGSKTSILLHEILINGKNDQVLHLPITYLFVVE